MMILPFLLKFIMASGLLTIYYLVALRNRPCHQYNRIYLLLSLVIPLILPFIDYRGFTAGQYTDPFQLRPAITNLAVPFTLSITAGMLIILGNNIRNLYRLKSNYVPQRRKGYTFIATDLEQAPFCFLDNLFWRNSIPLDEPAGKNIFIHELTHIQDKHGYDKLFCQVLLCFCWFNPFYWMIRKELNLIHEFIADARAFPDGETASLAYMLLPSPHRSYSDPTHSFFYSPIKRRLIMITKSSAPHSSLWNRALALPVCFLVMLACSFSVVQAQTGKEIVAKISYVKKDGKTTEISATVMYAFATATPAPTKKVTVSSAIQFQQKDGSMETITLPVSYDAIDTRPSN